METISRIWYDVINTIKGNNSYRVEETERETEFSRYTGDNMQIAVCDDEKIYRAVLMDYVKNCIALHDYNDVTIDSYCSGEELLEAYSKGKSYDMLFLDIKMKEMNGFNTAKCIRDFDKSAMIIFVTSLADYIFGSFEYRPFWFLIKPVSEEKFRHVFNKALTEIMNAKNREYSFFTRENGLLSIDINKIMYIESMLRRIVIHTGTEKYTNYASISSEEEKLRKYDFVRIHKGFLVNMAYIQRINKNNVILKNSMVLPLSEHRLKTVFDSFTSFLARCSV